MPVTVVRPVVERIGAAIAKRLDLLTSGFSSHFIASEVVRPQRFAQYTPRDNQIVVAYGENEAVEELSRPGNPPAMARDQTFNIYCHVMPSEKDPTAVDEYMSVVASEVVRAVSTPPANWHNFTGLAIDAVWESHEQIDSERVSGVNVPLRVLYRTDENNPYIARA